jgi:hypothetical protein
VLALQPALVLARLEQQRALVLEPELPLVLELPESLVRQI